MANFHEVFLGIGGDAQNMYKVLDKLYKNALTNEVNEGYSNEVPEAKEYRSIVDLYPAAEDEIDPYYSLAFAVPPEDRYLSETACVDLYKVASRFVLVLCYSTAWEINRGDLGSFFKSIQDLDIAAITFEADEGDGHEEVSASTWAIPSDAAGEIDPNLAETVAEFFSAPGMANDLTYIKNSILSGSLLPWTSTTRDELAENYPNAAATRLDDSTPLLTVVFQVLANIWGGGTWREANPGVTWPEDDTGMVPFERWDKPAIEAEILQSSREEASGERF